MASSARLFEVANIPNMSVHGSKESCKTLDEGLLVVAAQQTSGPGEELDIDKQIEVS